MTALIAGGIRFSFFLAPLAILHFLLPLVTAIYCYFEVILEDSPSEGGLSLEVQLECFNETHLVVVPQFERGGADIDFRGEFVLIVLIDTHGS